MGARPENPSPNTLGLHRVMFAVDDIDDTVARLRAHDAELLGEVAQYESIFRLCYLRGPAGIIVDLARPGMPAGTIAESAISVGKDRARSAPPGLGWQTGRREPFHRGLFFRGGQQPADAIGVRDDMMDGRDAGEPGVCRHERLSSCRVGRGGQDRVERAEARSFLEQA